MRRLVATSRMSRESFGDMRKGMLRTRNAMCFLAVAQCLYGQLPDHDPAMGLETALERVSENFGVRVGLEYRVSAATTRAVRFPSRAATAGAALTSIVRQVAGYRWRFERSVAHVYESTTVQDGRNWLNMTLSENPSTNEPFMTTKAASVMLMQRVQARVRPDLRGRGIGGSFPGSAEEPRFKLAIRRGTVRDYLNEIVRIGRARMWVVRFSEMPSVTPAGFFEVAATPAGDSRYPSPLWTLTSMRSVRGPMIVKHPIVLKRVEPGYSDEARRFKHEGSVMLIVEIDSAGKPSARVVRPIGLGLDEKALKAVQSWRFRPVYDGGKPVPARTTVELAFRLR